MADYFLLLDGVAFETKLRPALTASWRQRSFEPCIPLCQELAPAARDFTQRYHTGDQPILCQLAVAASALPFERGFWRALVGEMLLYSAQEIPEFQLVEQTLSDLLFPGIPAAVERGGFTPIQQIHRGTRDLSFGAAVYRPDNAGYNNATDVERLADYLDAINPTSWIVANVAGSNEEEDREDELEFAREWFPSLREMYQRARDGGCVVVIESIY